MRDVYMILYTNKSLYYVIVGTTTIYSESDVENEKKHTSTVAKNDGFFLII